MTLLHALRQRPLPVPEILQDPLTCIFKKGSSVKEKESVKKLFPHTTNQSLLVPEKGLCENLPLKVGVLFSGGPAPGGHNVIYGLRHTLNRLHPSSRLIGFLNGPSGLLERKYIDISSEKAGHYLHTGGFDMLGSGRTKIETSEQLDTALTVIRELQLNGLVIIGGDDSNTNAAVLAEFFQKNKVEISVTGIPKTIDGDLRSEMLEISFGFDTATKLYSELIGNLASDARSSKKYYHFVKLMGRSASHITLECALRTRPNMALIGEEIRKESLSVDQLIEQMVDIIVKRSANGKNYGIFLIPEGLPEFIPEWQGLNDEIRKLSNRDKKFDEQKLSDREKRIFLSLPEEIRRQLLLERDSHGNIPLSKIETEKFLAEQIEMRLVKSKTDGIYKGKFDPLFHYFGYEGRSAHPSFFDASYAHALGVCAALLIRQKYTGYMACLHNLKDDPRKWIPGALPLTSLLVPEIRNGIEKLVIRKSPVDTASPSFRYFAKNRDRWALEDDYLSPGPLQFFGNPDLFQTVPQTLLYGNS